MSQTFKTVPAPIGHVFAHSLWRTGSTALAKAFLDSPDYLVFYEPFHEDCGSPHRIEKTRRAQARRTQDLNHPEWQGGYFDTYLLTDPQTNRPLWQLFDRSCTLITTYRDRPSAKALNYLRACQRVAEALGKRAFFGFCRSGRQQAGMSYRPEDQAFYLMREPRSQFLSYNWPDNRYFVGGTLLQLLSAPQSAPLVHALIPADQLPPRHKISLLRYRPTVAQIRTASRGAKALSEASSYKIFYLSHHLSRAAAQSSGLACYTMDDILAERTRLEQDFGISLAALRSTQRDIPDADRFAIWEDEVLTALAQQNLL